MSNQNNILVTGATGQQGGAVARELLTQGYRVKAMTRNTENEKAQTLAGFGAEIIQGDLNDVDSLNRATNGVWGVFAVQNTWEAGVEKEEEQGKRIAEIARTNGVQHFVYSSVGSAHRHTGIPHFDNKWRIEETVRSLGFPSFTIIRPVFFMDNFISEGFKPGLDQGKLMIGLKPETVLQMIAVKDIGKYGLWAFENYDELNGRAIDIAGDALTMPEAAKTLSSVNGKSVGFFQVPIEEVRKFSDDYALMLEWFDRFGYEADIDGLSKESGIKPTPFADWAAQTDWT